MRSESFWKGRSQRVASKQTLRSRLRSLRRRKFSLILEPLEPRHVMTGMPVVSIVGDASASEGGNMVFHVTLSQPCQDDLGFYFGISSSTTTADDFHPLDPLWEPEYSDEWYGFTIGADETSYDIVVAVDRDAIRESTENFTLSLYPQQSEVVEMGDDQATGTIYDDTPVISISAFEATEGSGLVLRAALDHPVDFPVEFYYVLEDGTATNEVDYLWPEGLPPEFIVPEDVPLHARFNTIPENEDYVDIFIPTMRDGLREEPEFFTATLLAAPYVEIDSAQATVQATILDGTPSASFVLDDNVIPGIKTSVNEGGVLSIPIVLDRPAADYLQLTYFYVPIGDPEFGSLLGETDWVAPQSSTVTFEPNSTVSWLHFQTLRDGQVQGNRVLITVFSRTIAITA